MTIPALPTISPECLTVINDQVTTTSIDVARIFGKRCNESGKYAEFVIGQGWQPPANVRWSERGDQPL